MWAQLIKTDVKAGKEEEIERLHQQFQNAEQPVPAWCGERRCWIRRTQAWSI